jgi:hypothetical protein
VYEIMTVSANLKLGRNLSEKAKQLLVSTWSFVCLLTCIKRCYCCLYRNQPRTSRPSYWHSNLLYGRHRVQISAQKPDILTQVFRGFSQPIKANAGMVPVP